LRLQLLECGNGVRVPPGNRIVYDVERNEASFGEGAVDGHALVWELTSVGRGEGVKLWVELELDRSEEYLMRCDRVDFPPGGVAYLHTHQGPGIRRLLHGSIRIETEGRSDELVPGGTWFEAGPEPVFAAASETEETAFVRVLILPRRLLGQSSIHYVQEEDVNRPKPQRYTVFVDEPIELT